MQPDVATVMPVDGTAGVAHDEYVRDPLDQRVRQSFIDIGLERDRFAADLSLYFDLRTTGVDDSRALLARLNALAIVEIAYPRERPTPPPSATLPIPFVSMPGDIPPVTPSFSARQGYADPAPNGIDGGAIRSLTGAWGDQQTVLDIEWGWWFDHEDIQALRPSSLVGPPLSRTSFNNHGTAVSGEMAADADEWGVTGLTPDIELLCVTNYPASGYSVARAIVVAMTRLGKGDVMLLEAQTRTPLGLGPTEWNQADFDAIQKRDARGRHHGRGGRQRQRQPRRLAAQRALRSQRARLGCDHRRCE